MWTTLILPICEEIMNEGRTEELSYLILVLPGWTMATTGVIVG